MQIIQGAGTVYTCQLGTWTTVGGGGGGTVTSVSGTANQIAVATGTTTPALSITNPFLPPGPIQTVAGTSSAPQYSFATETGFGWFRPATGRAGLAGNGAERFAISTSGSTYLIQPSTGVYGFGASSFTDASAPDTGISRDSAGVIDVGNGTQGNTSGTIKTATLTLTNALTLPNNSTATTQSANDNSTKVATTAYVNAIAAGSPAGPQYDYFQCQLQSTGAATSNACNSTINVTSGDKIAFFCAVFNNDTGTATLSASDSLTSTVSQLATFYGTNTGFRLSAWLLTATSSGADTFTCTDSASKTFWSLVAVKVTGTTAADVTSTNDAASGGTRLSGLLTTTVDNDLAFMWDGAGAGEGSATMSATGGFNIIQASNPSTYLGVKKLAKAGTYTLQMFSGSSTWSTLSVALK